LLLSLCVMFVSCKKNTDSNISLFGKWKVEGFIANTSSNSETATNPVYLTFNNNKTTEIELEINSCSGSYSLDQRALLITNMGCAEACCESDFSEGLMDLLPLVKTHYFTNGKLNLAGDDNLNIRLTKE
jgi:hypothetical protein